MDRGSVSSPVDCILSENKKWVCLDDGQSPKPGTVLTQSNHLTAIVCMKDKRKGCKKFVYLCKCVQCWYLFTVQSILWVQSMFNSKELLCKYSFSFLIPFWICFEMWHFIYFSPPRHRPLSRVESIRGCLASHKRKENSS